MKNPETLLTPNKIQNLKDAISFAPNYGCFVEVGVYRGGSLKIIAEMAPAREIFGFDTFEGLPEETWVVDEPHTPGEFKTDFLTVRDAFANFQNVSIMQGVFPRSGSRLGLREVAFCHLDMDHWRGTLSALQFIWPFMVKGGVILFDDYGWHKCPGIAPLVDTWAAATKSQLKVYPTNQAFIRK